ERERKLGALGQELQNLTSTSKQIEMALADNRSRGQWGERTAKNILDIMGFIEGLNYYEQKAMSNGGRPDFTFKVADDFLLNMDVKFPLTNYLNYLAAEADTDKEQYRKQFLRDVNDRVKEIEKRGYIDENTVDMALIFIPNEHIYRFIHEQDDQIIDNALSNRIVLCSPLTLYIVLAIMRQAARNFNLEKHSRQILEVLADIKNQWENYVKTMDTLDNHLNKATEAYSNLVGIRKRQLDKRFDKIEQLQEEVSAIEAPEEQAAD
ncbi:MAG: DNA recombination protein RmuC, partial [Chloroflexota bacterium]